jgi:ABC-2 type transport system permease protein
VAVGLGQIVLIVAVGAVVLGLPVPVNAPVLLLGALGGVVVFLLLAAASAVFTRTVETAQVTTLPILMACMFGSSIMMPVSALPDALAAVLRLLPLSPVVELMRLGWLGTTGDSAPVGFLAVFAAAAVPAGILLAWVVVGVVVVRRWFRWEPRR